MARTVQVHLLDDIDGSLAEETVKFSLDGLSYEIDLNAAHSEQLRKAMAKYIVAGRRATLGVPSSRGRRANVPAHSARPRSQAIREWAKRSGIEVSDRGRIPSSVVERFEKDNA